ncbi:MAG: flagellar basal body L-ring protein FlgH [Lentisphaerae bacterium]|nr:flagellar basal body L-ring protein FlgH [Lentisphaerota bacterium]
MASRLYTDVKAHRVGDLLTVLVMESSSSTKEANSKTDKKTALSGNLSFFHPRMDNNPTAWTNVVIPAFSAEAARNFEGSGTMKNEETVTSTITVRVIEVLPNGNLLVEGKRFMNIQGETLTYLLSGTVRTTDITRDNTVKSTSIGDLNIQTLSQGTIARNQKKGLFTQIVDWVNPF